MRCNTRTSSDGSIRSACSELAAACAIAVALGACSGRIPDAPADPDLANEPGDDPPDVRDGQRDPGADVALDSIVLPPAPRRLALLTSEQLRASLGDLLGIDASRIETPGDVPVHGFSTVGASSLALSASAAETIDRSVRTAVEAVFADEARRTRLTGCPAVVDASCADRFVREFGRRAFRRPLEEAERARLRAVFDKVTGLGGSGWRGLQMTTTAILTSPKFLYLGELGARDASGAETRLTGHEVAARLSYWLTGSTPDLELLDAAERGDLDDPAGIEDQVRRLLASPRAGSALARFFGELYLLPVDRLGKDATVFPFVARNPLIGASMRDETTRLANHIVFERDGDIAELFDASYTFVDPLLAEFYGVPPHDPRDGRVVWRDDSARGGLMTHAGILAALSKEAETVPTRRGRFVRERLLCQPVPDPPPDVLMDLPESASAVPPTQRERLQVHNHSPSCRGCHEILDPIGLVLEQFDAAGQYRERDHGQPIDTSGTLDGVPVANARELGRALRAHPDALPCLVKHVYRYATGGVEPAGHEETFARLARRLATVAEGRLREVMLQMALHASFRTVASP